MAGFLTPLKLEFLDGKKWKLLEPLRYHVGAPRSRESVYVPAEYLTDFASVPRGLWNIFPPTGPYGKAAVVHDYLYQHRRVIVDSDPYSRTTFITRAQADAIFREAMQVLGVKWWPRVPVFLGVRVGGWLSWNRYREEERDVELEW